TMWERSKISRVSWPKIVIATLSEDPAAIRLRVADVLQSWMIRPVYLLSWVPSTSLRAEDPRGGTPSTILLPRSSFPTTQRHEPSFRVLDTFRQYSRATRAFGSAPCGTRRHPPRFALVACQRIQRIEAVDLTAVCVQNPGEFFLNPRRTSDALFKMDWLDGSRARPRSRYYRRAGALGGFGTASGRPAHRAARCQREVQPLPEHPRLCDRRGRARRSRQRPLGHPGEVQAGLCGAVAL